MECYHGIVSLDHAVAGSLDIGGSAILFDEGRGYIEKDWGSSFPKAYVWMQSNHFDRPGVSFNVSVADIPWFGTSFTGFIAALLIDNTCHKFTTYNGTSLRSLEISTAGVSLVLENRNHRLEVSVDRPAGAPLSSPIRGLMDGRVEESMGSTVAVTLMHRKDHSVIFRGNGHCTALEVAGNTKSIITPLVRHS